MKIIAITNIKGGVGKTTTAVNLAYVTAATGRSSVLWDLDPQGAATYILRCEAGDQASARKLVSGKRELAELVLSSGYQNLDVIPADFSYRNFDLHLSERKRPTERLLKMSRTLRDRYEMLLLDCPPGISLLSENVLRASDAIVVPMIPSPLSIRMLTQLQDFITDNEWHDLRLLPFFSMVDRRKSIHRELVTVAREKFPAMLATEVPYWSEIERMSIRRAPLPAYAPASAAGQIYAALWHEVENRLRAAPPPAAATPAPTPALPPNPTDASEIHHAPATRS